MGATCPQKVGSPLLLEELADVELEELELDELDEPEDELDVVKDFASPELFLLPQPTTPSKTIKNNRFNFIWCVLYSKLLCQGELPGAE